MNSPGTLPPEPFDRMSTIPPYALSALHGARDRAAHRVARALKALHVQHPAEAAAYHRDARRVGMRAALAVPNPDAFQRGVLTLVAATTDALLSPSRSS